MLLWLAGHNSPTYDEPLHFAAGTKGFFEGDTSVDSLHPPTLRVLGVALSALFGFDPPINLPGAKNGDHVLLGSALFQAPSQINLLIPRATIAALVAFTMWVLFRNLKDLFGAKAALLTLVLWVTCPTLLAHAHLFTTDAVPAGLVVLAFVFHLRAVRDRSSPIAAWLTLGFAIAGKATLLPFAAIMFVLTLRPRMRSGSLLPQAVAVTGPLVALAVLWAPYVVLNMEVPFGPPQTPAPTRLSELLTTLPLLPADLSTGLVGRISLNQPTSFLLGETYVGGRWYYFPVALLIKSQVSTLIAIGVAATLTLRKKAPGVTSHLAFPGICYLIVLAAGDFNIGVRHALVVMLFALTAIGAASASASRRVRTVFVALALLGAAETTMQFPNTISFSNIVAGGYPRTHEYLSDSNVDWGQDAERAVRLARAEAAGEPAFAYFGTAPPANAEIVSLDRALNLVESEERAVLISYSRLSRATAEPARPPDLAIGGSVALWLPPHDR